MEFFTDTTFANEKDKRIKQMMPYQINKELLKESNAYIMHDMPIHRGYEISPEAIENPKAIIYEQAEKQTIFSKRHTPKTHGIKNQLMMLRIYSIRNRLDQNTI